MNISLADIYVITLLAAWCLFAPVTQLELAASLTLYLPLLFSLSMFPCLDVPALDERVGCLSRCKCKSKTDRSGTWIWRPHPRRLGDVRFSQSSALLQHVLIILMYTLLGHRVLQMLLPSAIGTYSTASYKGTCILTLNVKTPFARHPFYTLSTIVTHCLAVFLFILYCFYVYFITDPSFLPLPGGVPCPHSSMLHEAQMGPYITLFFVVFVFY